MICQRWSMLTSLREKKGDGDRQQLRGWHQHTWTQIEIFFHFFQSSLTTHLCSKSPLAQAPQHPCPSPAVHVFITTVSGAWQLNFYLFLEVPLLPCVPWHYMCWPMTICCCCPAASLTEPDSVRRERTRVLLWVHQMSYISLNLFWHICEDRESRKCLVKKWNRCNRTQNQSTFTFTTLHFIFGLGLKWGWSRRS